LAGSEKMTITSTLISDAIAAQIKENQDFAGAQIYFERSVQNFKRPCFFVTQQSLTNEKRMLNDYFRTYYFTISWFPEKADERFFREKCEETAEKMLGILRVLKINSENITLENWIENLSYEILEDHLSLIFQIKMKTIWDDPIKPPFMETLEKINENVKLI
jgi:hypothetical protein